MPIIPPPTTDILLYQNYLIQETEKTMVRDLDNNNSNIVLNPCRRTKGPLSILKDSNLKVDKVTSAQTHIKVTLPTLEMKHLSLSMPVEEPKRQKNTSNKSDPTIEIQNISLYTPAGVPMTQKNIPNKHETTVTETKNASPSMPTREVPQSHPQSTSKVHAPPVATGKQKFSMPAEASKADKLDFHKHDIQLAELWVWLMNQHNLSGMMAISEDDCHIHFAESDMRQEDFFVEIRNLFESFPDFSFTWNHVNQTAPGRVEIGFFQASGTHTGKPYGFGPYPEVDPEGIKVKNDPEKVIFQIHHDKITDVTFIPSGPMTGPPGVYMQIGGFPIF